MFGVLLAHLFILDLQCRQSRLQLLTSLHQLTLHWLLGTQLRHLEKEMAPLKEILDMWL